MESRRRILYLEANPPNADTVIAALQSAGIACQPVWVPDLEAYRSALEKESFDLIFSELSPAGYDGLAALASAQEKRPDVPFLFVFGAHDEAAALACMQAGATDLVFKDQPTRLALAVRRALEAAEMRAACQRAEAQRREQAALLDLAQEALIVHDAQGIIRFWNKGAKALYGWPAEQATGRNVWQLLFEDTQFLDLEHIQGVLREKGAWCGKLSQITEDGRKVTVEAHLARVCDSQEQTQFILVANTDITESTILEQQFLRSQRMECLGRLAGGVAHDFNNILTVIQLHASLLQATKELPREAVDSAQQIAQAVEHAANLTRPLLMFSTGKFLQPSHIDINQVVSNLSKMCRRILGEDIVLELQLAPKLPPVEADRGMIEQVLLNLAVNSRDAMPKGGHLSLNTTRLQDAERRQQAHPGAQTGACVCLSVSDTGCGIAPEHLPHVFEPFFTTKELGKGTGLGLTTVHSIVEQHGGWIEVSSTVGKGTTFQIFLPGVEDKATDSAATATAESIPSGTETILVVEDEPPVRASITRLLEHYGYRVFQATSGAEALSVWQEHKGQIDLLLTDSVLPRGMTGQELAAALRREKPELKIIFTSGYGTERLAQDFLALRGSTALLRKPFEAGALARAIRGCFAVAGRQGARTGSI